MGREEEIDRELNAATSGKVGKGRIKMTQGKQTCVYRAVTGYERGVPTVPPCCFFSPAISLFVFFPLSWHMQLLHRRVDFFLLGEKLKQNSGVEVGGEAGDGDGTPLQCKKKRDSEAQSCEIQPEGENGVGGEVGVHWDFHSQWRITFSYLIHDTSLRTLMAASDICVSKNTGRCILLILYDLLMSGSLVCITDHIFRSLY